ncbi:MAG: class I SAM-dependent methyltransferase, partial [Chloroflexota bacterium]
VSVTSLTYPILAGTIGFWGLPTLLVSLTAGLTGGVVLISKLVPSIRRVPSDCDYEWHSWWRGNVFQRYWKRRITNIIIGMAGRPGRVLELGCGSSPTLNFLGCTGIGVDCDKGKIDFMKGRSPGYISYEVCDLSTPEHLLKYGEFDLIVMNEVIEHLKEPAEILSILPRLLTEKGRLIVATPDYNHKLWLLAEKFTLYKDGHVYKFTRELLEEECLKVGLKPLGYEYVVGCDLVEVFVKT